MTSTERFARLCVHPREWIKPFMGGVLWCALCGSVTAPGCAFWVVPGGVESNRNKDYAHPSEPFRIPSC